MQKKIIAAVIIFIAAIGIVFGMLICLQRKNSAPADNFVIQNKTKNVDTTKTETSQTNEITTKPTGSATSIADQVVSQLQTEEDNFSAEDADAKASAVNQEDLNNLGQSYDENEF
jgi:hypothetical protein